MAYLPILTYHRLLAGDPTRLADPKRIAVSQEQFHRHVRWLKRFGYRTVRLEDYVGRLKAGESIPGRTFAITFDDGYEEVLTLGLPVLQELDCTATVFAVPGEAQNRWDGGGARLMDADQLRRWHKAGMGVGAHTLHHPHLTQVGSATAQRELVECKRILETWLGTPITLLAYPYGESDASIDRLAREAGYQAAFATDRASAEHSRNLYRLRRPVIFPRNTVWEVLLKAQRWYPAYQDWKRPAAERGEVERKSG
jgi:peptidoglycan/xylan/chitin deacetylase (PgdA/CDA1 family)